MSNANQFEWVDFYKELAEKLLDYKDNRKELLENIYKIYDNTGLKLPKLGAVRPIRDIDPFTFFGLFNKGISNANRNKIILEISKLFGITATIPSIFDGIPLLNNQNATFHWFGGDDSDNDINVLWDFFESALLYVKNPSDNNLEILSEYFDIVINKKGNGNSKVTMALFWIAPDSYLNLDSRNIWYIYDSEKLPKDFVETLPKIEPKMSSKTYFEITKKVKEYVNSDESLFNDFKELSYEAWRYSEEVNKKIREEKKPKVNDESNNFTYREVEDVEKDLVSDSAYIAKVEGEEIKYLPYTSEDFFKEVYMDRKEYDILVDLIKNKKNVILQGAPGVGKTFIAKMLAYSIMGEIDYTRVNMIQFHQSYSYEDFIMGFRPSENGFDLTYGVFYNFCKAAEKDEEKEYFFIIDEINRGNISKIFGELFMLIENDKRGNEVQLLYSDDNEKFSVPENVYIIGMMNTADRSLAMLDYALRRRFSFYDMKPIFDTESFRKYKEGLSSEKFDSLINAVQNLNEVIYRDDSLGEGFCIGHSYFCNFKKDMDIDKALNRIVEFELIPLLKEYWFDDPVKVKNWTDNLRSAIK
ncbi:MAG: AAA family ATPase [Bacillota bacterium]|jgi:5-methylcytosine-specific restriction protein B|nr:AAA family ATPase [Bacillota bacterium]NLP21257.1 AAA domain-containing protein [Erysipelotrichaceae bacterium]